MKTSREKVTNSTRILMYSVNFPDQTIEMRCQPVLSTSEEMNLSVCKTCSQIWPSLYLFQWRIVVSHCINTISFWLREISKGTTWFFGLFDKLMVGSKILSISGKLLPRGTFELELLKYWCWLSKNPAPSQESACEGEYAVCPFTQKEKHTSTPTHFICNTLSTPKRKHLNNKTVITQS